MDDELRILLENVSGRFEALSREIADASADAARFAAGTTTVAPFTVTVVPPPPMFDASSRDLATKSRSND